MQDMIYRQVAIDAFKKELTTGEPKGNYITICSAVSFEGAKQILEALPAVQSQPEIIRCKDCVWRDGSICRNNDTMPWSDDDFCSFAERRTDG